MASDAISDPPAGQAEPEIAGQSTASINPTPVDDGSQQNATSEHPPSKSPMNTDTKPNAHDELRHRDWREKRDAEQTQAKSRSRSPRRDGDSKNERRRSRSPARGGNPFRGRSSRAAFRGYGNRFDNRRFRNNIKSREHEMPESKDPVEIRQQVEFYFSDSNLATDKYLFGQTGGSENRPVPIKTIHNFKRMRRFQPYSAVVAALRDSTTLEVFDGVENSTEEKSHDTNGDAAKESSEAVADGPADASAADVSDSKSQTTATGNETIARRVPLPVEFKAPTSMANLGIFEDATRPRSIYAKGFTVPEKPSTQVDIEAFFKPYGPINAIRLRRSHPEKEFKGSVFVEFNTEELQKKFLDLDPKPQWDGKDLKVMSKEKYVTGKAEDVKHQRIPSNRRGDNPQGRGNGRGPRKEWRGRRDTNDHKDAAGHNKRKRGSEDGDKPVNKVSAEGKDDDELPAAKVRKSEGPAHEIAESKKEAPAATKADVDQSTTDHGKAEASVSAAEDTAKPDTTKASAAPAQEKEVEAEQMPKTKTKRASASTAGKKRKSGDADVIQGSEEVGKTRTTRSGKRL